MLYHSIHKVQRAYKRSITRKGLTRHVRYSMVAQSTQVQAQVNARQIQIAQLISEINQLTQHLAAANIA